MKKLIAAALLCASTAFAQANPQTETQKNPKTTDTGAPVPEQPRSQQGRKVSTGVEATEVAPGLRKAGQKAGEKAKHAAGLQTEADGTFKTAQAFDLDGMVKDPGGGRVTIVREGLPDAGLDVRKNTKVTLDGKKVDAKSLPEGARVRAKFQIEGKEIVALSLDATSRGTGGSGAREELREDANKVEQKADEAADKTKQETRETRDELRNDDDK